MSANILTLLPEYVMTIFGVLIMLLEPLLPANNSRKALGWLAAAGAVVAGAATLYQFRAVKIAGPMQGFSGTVQADSFSVFFHLLIASVVLVTLLGSLDYFHGKASHAGEYFALVLFGATGMMLMTSSTELLMVFVGLEISSISTYIMAGMRKGEAASSESAIKYFLLGSFATAFFLYGIALGFGATGTTSIPKLAAGLAVTHTPLLAITAVAMILIGLGFKVSAAPFQVWTPDVYQGAPAPVVGLMSTAPKAAAFAVLLRVLFSGYPMYEHKWSTLLWAMAVLSMCVGNLGALLQTDVKRMLAYSSIAHAGYLIVAFTAYPAESISAVAFYTAAYAAMNVGAFLVVGQLAGFAETRRTVRDYAGVMRTHPALGAAMTLFLLSMIGIPFTAGFFAKFYVFTAAVHTGHVWLITIGLLNSGVACFYYLRLIASMFSERAEGETVHAQTRLELPVAIAVGLCAAAVLLLGIAPGRVIHLTQRGGWMPYETTQSGR